LENAPRRAGGACARGRDDNDTADDPHSAGTTDNDGGVDAAPVGTGHERTDHDPTRAHPIRAHPRCGCDATKRGTLTNRPPRPRAAAIPHTSGQYIVEPGDNLWSIARAALGWNARDDEVAPYWKALIGANRSHLRSGDPNLIFPGEVLGLPDREANQ
jgi:nucleoid-associated protein YgaU